MLPATSSPGPHDAISCRAQSGSSKEKSLEAIKKSMDGRTLRDRAANLRQKGVMEDPSRKRCPYCDLRHDSRTKVLCRHRYRQDVYASLLARGSETVYLFTKAAIPPKGTPPDIRIWHWPSNSEDPHSMERGPVEMEKTLNPNGLDRSRGVIHAVLQHWQENAGHLAFTTHVGTLAALLRRRHSTSPRTIPGRMAWVEMTRYVYLISNEKMIARLETGKRGSNLFSILTARCVQFPAGAFEQGIMAAKFERLMPNKYQAHFIKDFWLLTGHHKADVCERLSQQPLYDIAGRQHFHNMLSTSLMMIQKALQDLQAALTKLRRINWVFNDDDKDEITLLIVAARTAVNMLWWLIKIFSKVLKCHLECLSWFTDVKSPFTSSCVLERQPAGDVQRSQEVSDENPPRVTPDSAELLGGERDGPKQRASSPPRNSDIGGSIDIHAQSIVSSGDISVSAMTEALSEGTRDEGSQGASSILQNDRTGETTNNDTQNNPLTSDDAFIHLAEMSAVKKRAQSEWAKGAWKYLYSICLFATALEETIESDCRRRTTLDDIESRQIRDSKVVVLDVQTVNREE